MSTAVNKRRSESPDSDFERRSTTTKKRRTVLKEVVTTDYFGREKKILVPQEILIGDDDENDDSKLALDHLLKEVEATGASRYKFGRVLGSGLCSTVRRCLEKSTQVEYAVKIIDLTGEKGETYKVEQLQSDTIREIHILRKCEGHPNIVELHDVFETQTYIFLVFELCKNGELFDYLTNKVCLSEKRTRLFMKQILEVVDFLHAKNITHRDLKPENILLDDELNVKVTDFGFALEVKPEEELTELCGTAGYLAPETLMCNMYESVHGYNREVDLWACGVIMYTMMCGSPPFWHRKQMMMLRMIMEGKYAFHSPEWDDISQTAKDLISKLLVVEPKKRLTAANALQHAFFRIDKKEQAPTPSREKTGLVRVFYPRKKFKAAIICLRFFYRIQYFFLHPSVVSYDVLLSNPYSIKQTRKLIDTCAFKMYGHWVKRGDNQNRAALFEHMLRDDWKADQCLTQLVGYSY